MFTISSPHSDGCEEYRVWVNLAWATLLPAPTKPRLAQPTPGKPSPA